LFYPFCKSIKFVVAVGVDNLKAVVVVVSRCSSWHWLLASWTFQYDNS